MNKLSRRKIAQYSKNNLNQMINIFGDSRNTCNLLVLER